MASVPALTMPLGERRERHQQLMLSLREQGFNARANEFISTLRSSARAPEVRAAS